MLKMSFVKLVALMVLLVSQVSMVFAESREANPLSYGEESAEMSQEDKERLQNSALPQPDPMERREHESTKQEESEMPSLNLPEDEMD